MYKERDILLLKNKAKHENLVNSIGAKVGDKVPTIVDKDKFRSNIEEFQRLGLDPNDPEDVDFYQRSGYQRLNFEIAGQKLINIIMRLNRFDEETIRDFVLDILAALCCCIQCYVDQETGEIKYTRIFPEEAMGIWGNRRDGTDDIAQGYQKNITVREFLGRVGNEFEFARDWPQLLWAINYANNEVFTGFILNGNYFDATSGQLRSSAAANLVNDENTTSNNKFLDWSLAYTYKIYTGYIEFESIDATATYLAKVATGEITPRQVDFDFYMGSKEENKEYYKENFYQYKMYKSYFLVTSSTSQWIFNWGKVYYQELYGAFDQFAKGTLFYYRLEGISPAEISDFYIEFANMAAYKLKWLAYKAKPQDDEYVISELIKVAKSMQRLYPQNDKTKVPTLDNILSQLIQYQRENTVILRDYPEIEGKTHPVLHPLHSNIRPPDPIASWMQALEKWCEDQIAEKVGLNDLRLGQIQNARQGLKQGQEETEASQNSTGYLFRMIQYTKEHLATTTLNYAQDIVRFKDSIPYKYLLKLLGDNELENIKLLKDFSSCRLGIVFQDYNTQLTRQAFTNMVMRMADSGDGRGGLSPIEVGILLGEENYMNGFKLLNYLKYKEDKKKRKQEIETIKMQQQHEMAMEKQKEQTEKTKGGLAIQKEQIPAGASIKVAEINNAGKKEVKEMGIQSEPTKQQSKTEGQKEIISHKANTEAEKPLLQ